MKGNDMNADLRKSFRYTRHLARAYRAGIRRQEVAPQEWREEGLEALTRELRGVLDWWAAQGLAQVYDRAISPEWDWRHP